MTPGATPARRVGYRLFGPAFDYLLHFRPVEWPIVAAHAALGCILAVGWPGLARGDHVSAALFGIALWVVCLNGGTLAINSAFDRDEGDVAYLRRPPPPPKHLFLAGMGAMLTGLGASLLLPRGFVAAYAACLVMSVLYSVPPVRLKARAGFDWIVNLVGFGVLTPFAGWAATGRALNRTDALVLLAFGPLFAALYPLTQLYQLDEDRRRGDRTLAVRLGRARSLDVAIVAAALAFAVFIEAGRTAGWTSHDWGRWLVLAAAATGWAAVLLPWRARAGAVTPAAEQRGMYWALGAWAVTDVAVAALWTGLS